jgi:hypothetical protein
MYANFLPKCFSKVAQGGWGVNPIFFLFSFHRSIFLNNIWTWQIWTPCFLPFPAEPGDGGGELAPEDRRVAEAGEGRAVRQRVHHPHAQPVVADIAGNVAQPGVDFVKLCNKTNDPGANPMIASYNASDVVIYSATSSLVHNEKKNILLYFEKML